MMCRSIIVTNMLPLDLLLLSTAFIFLISAIQDEIKYL